jgi:NAD(P)H-flavin reductase
MIDIFIPSYHRPTNVKTAKYFVGLGYDPKKIHVFVDSETDDIHIYEEEMKKIGVNLHVFDMDEARKRYDYVHRASLSRRSAGQARNMFQDFAMKNNIDFYLVQDDDTNNF